MPTCIVIGTQREKQTRLKELASASSFFSDFRMLTSAEDGIKFCAAADCILITAEAVGQKGIGKLCQSAAERNVPVIAVDPRSAEERIFALESGVSECLPPDTSLREGILRIRKQIELKQRIDRLQRDRELLSQQALTDSLTGLYNRRYFQERLEAEMVRSHRTGERLALVIIDVDHFKLINDTFGHSIGDHILHEIAQILKKHIRRSDVISRYGGEEFALLLPGVNAQSALSVTRKLHRRISEAGRSNKVQVTVSMGISISDPSLPSNPKTLFEEADQALYSAKRKGRNRTILFPSPAPPTTSPLFAFTT